MYLKKCFLLCVTSYSYSTLRYCRSISGSPHTRRSRSLSVNTEKTSRGITDDIPHLTAVILSEENNSRSLNDLIDSAYSLRLLKL